jgi:RNA polymerase sigma factor (sigma-70 family)
MATQLLHTLIQRLHRTVHAPGDGTLTDGELLERWARQRDQAAFELLQWRHGPMVLSTCRRLLSDPHAAEDAYQATWLILVRKAGSIRRGEALAAWLHRVAVRVALRARASAARRRSHEQTGLIEAPAAALPDDMVNCDLRAVLDDEIDRLPGHHRRAFVLCCLEGKSYAEAASQLERPLGTIASWAARAREKLRIRLEHRGVTVAVSAVALGWTSDTLASGLPASLVASTVQAVTPLALGEALPAGLVSARAAALAHGVLRTMFLTRLKIAAVILLTMTAVALGAGGLLHRLRADGPMGESGRVPASTRTSAPPQESPSVATRKKPEPLLRVPMPDRTMMTVALSAHGKLLAISRHDRTPVQLWDVATGKERTLRGHSFSVTALAFSPDGKTLATATGSWLPDGAPGEIKLWDVPTGTERATLGTLRTTVLALAFSPDGKTLASASKTVKLWSIATQKEISEIPVSGGIPWSVAFAPNGKTLAAGVGVWEDKTPGKVILWDPATGKERATLSGHVGAVPCLAFTPDGRTLASADTRGTVKLWDVARARACASIANPGRSFLLQSLVVTSDGKRAIATIMGPHGPDLKEWDVATGKERVTYSGSPDRGYPVGLSPDGARVLLGSHPPVEGSGGRMELWELPFLKMSRLMKREDPQTAAPPGKRKLVVWLADASRAAFPDQPAAGRLHGKPFTVERARIAPYPQDSATVGDRPGKKEWEGGAILCLQQGKEDEPRNRYTIFLAVKPGDTVDGKTFLVPASGLSRQTEKIRDPDGKRWY